MTELDPEPILSMDDRSELKTNLRDQQSLGTADRTTLLQASQRTDQPDKFKLERHNLSYADLHCEITKFGKGVSPRSSGNHQKQVSPRSSGNHQKQHMDRRGNEEDELVKYMSSVPSYLERGKKPQDKVLNVGVLDWGRLEKWQCSHKQMLRRGSGFSLSSSNFSSSFSTDASSSHSSSGYISSPPGQKTRRPSLQFHLMSSPLEDYSQAVKSFGESVQGFHDLKDVHSDNLNEQGKFTRADLPFCNNCQDINPKEFKSKVSDPKIDQDSGTLRNGLKHGVASSTMVNMKTQDGQFMKRTEKPQERSPVAVDLDVPQNHKPVVLLLPRDLPQNDLSAISSLTDRKTALGQRPAEYRRRSFSDRSKDAELVPDFPNSVPLSCEVDIGQHLQMKRPSSIDAKINNLPSERSHLLSGSTKIGICTSGDRNVDYRKSTVTINKPVASGPSVGSDLKLSRVAPEKVRSTSPFRRLSLSMSKIGKNSSTKEASTLPQLNSTYVSVQSGSENTVASAHPDSSSGDKSNATTKARSSPLRRLLDPILKPKPANSHNILEPLPKRSILKEGTSKPSDERAFSSSVQALLRVAIKNGQPLFTFAVDNERDILAATMKKLSASKKEDCSCIYTFFTIQEVKKTNGRWLKPGGKGQSHDYIPNVVAQMKVCGSHFSQLTGEKYVNQFSTREFVLSSVDLRQADRQSSELEPNDELAAIIIKIPRRINRSSLIHPSGYQGEKPKDLTEVGLKGYLSEVSFDSNFGKNVCNWPCVGSQEINATVILPSGVHTLPHKGEPSSLIQRWKSGGSCDCGGWDLGCKLRVLGNWNQLIKKAHSSDAVSTRNQFALFSQGGVQENHPFFSLAPFKDGIYSVEYKSSLSLLQAFSICIAVLDSRELCDFSESRNLGEQKAYGETVLAQNGGTKVFDRVEEEVPARYVSYPPHSPVGRV